MTREILTEPASTDPVGVRLQTALDRGFAFYEEYLTDRDDLQYYGRLRDLGIFAALPESRIKSSGYVVDTLEAAVWCLLTTDSFEKALLKAVNLGEDTDTVGAVAGGLAGLYYGYEAIPEGWLSEIKKRDWIEKLCS
jgi:ADP-ribosylglycohydrolase